MGTVENNVKLEEASEVRRDLVMEGFVSKEVCIC